MDNIKLKQSVYFYSLYPPVALGVISLIACYIILALYLVCCRHVHKSSKHVPGIINCLIKITFRGSFTKNQNNEEKSELRLFGYQVPAGLINSLGLISMIVWVGVAAAFWIVLIGQNQSILHPENCDNQSSTTILDCEPISYNEVSLDYVRALGAAGGLLVLTTVILQGQTIILMWMMKKSQTKNRQIRRCWKLALVMVVSVPLGIEVLLFSGASTGMIFFELYNSIQHWIQFGSFVIAVFQSTYFSSITIYFTWKRRTALPRVSDIEQGMELLSVMKQNGGTMAVSNGDGGFGNSDDLANPLMG